MFTSCSTIRFVFCDFYNLGVTHKGAGFPLQVLALPASGCGLSTTIPNAGVCAFSRFKPTILYPSTNLWFCFLFYSVIISFHLSDSANCFTTLFRSDNNPVIYFLRNNLSAIFPKIPKGDL